MKRSTNEHLADIESDISRLNRMQGCVFRLLVNVRKRICVFEARVASSTLITVSAESYRQHGDRFLAFTFGGITTLGGSASLLALYFVTQESAFTRGSVALLAFSFALLILAVLEYRRMNSQLQEARKATTEAREFADSASEEGEALEEELAQVLAEWKELVPDDLDGRLRKQPPQE